jgi:hypothetical protein
LPAALALLAALTAPRLARAFPLTDPSTGLRVETDAVQAQVCRVIPPPDRAGAAACEGLDIVAITRRLESAGHRPTAAALLRFPDWAAVVVIKGLAGTKIVTEEAIDAFLRGVRSKLPSAAVMHSRSDAGRTHDIVKINGVDAVRTSVLLRVDETNPSYAGSSIRMFAFTSRSGTAIVSFNGPPERTTELTAAADAIVATVTMPDAGVPNFGRSRYEMIGEAIGNLIGALVLPVAGLVAFLIHRQKQKKAAPSPQRRA